MIQSIHKEIQFLKGFGIAISFSVLLLIIRILTVGSDFFLFLIWNLFLACIPYGTTLLLSFKNRINTSFFFWIGFIIWLIFLPNAPYILTDLQHLKVSTLHSIWFDVLLINSFAINGLFIGFVSLQKMHKLLYNRFNTKIATCITYCSLLLCGFGIYLGRVLRWNSWDIIDNPLKILSDITNRMIHPIEHIQTWGFTFGFGGFLMITFYLVEQYQKNRIKL